MRLILAEISNLYDQAAVDQAGAEMILQSERFGSPSYHTQFFTNNPAKYCADEPEVEQAEEEETAEPEPEVEQAAETTETVEEEVEEEEQTEVEVVEEDDEDWEDEDWEDDEDDNYWDIINWRW